MSPYASYLLETFLTLAVVCGLAYATLFGARRLGLGRPSGDIQVVGRLPLDARRAIYLVRVAGRVLVVGVGDGAMTKLAEMDAAELPPAAELDGKRPPFADVLARALRRGAP